MISDKQLLSDVLEGRTIDRSEVHQLGEVMREKSEFVEARLRAMKEPGYHPALFNRRHRGITG